MYESLNLFVIQRVTSVCHLPCCLYFILFEWIKMIYLKFTRVDFIVGQLKFKCVDVCVNTTHDLI